MAKKLSNAILKGRVSKLIASGAKFNEAMQELIIDIADYATNVEYAPSKKDKDGNSVNMGNEDVTPMTLLVDSLPRAVDKRVITDWFLRHVKGLRWFPEQKATDKKAARPAGFGKIKAKKGEAAYAMTFDIEAAKADLWHEVKKAEKEANGRTSAFNAVTRLESLIKSFHAAATDGKNIDGDNVPAEMLKELDAIFAKYNSDNMTTAIPAPTAENSNEPKSEKADEAIAKG